MHIKQPEHGKDTAEEIFHRLEEMRYQIAESLPYTGQQEKKKIVFLPYKASCWNSMESVWQEASQDPNYDVYVIPIPWCYRDWGGDLPEEWQYEAGQFPSYVPITDYREFSLEERHPDMIIIHNPYDSCNPTTSVLPAFYSEKLRHYTKNLIYIPWFLINEVDIHLADQDGKALYNMKYYVPMPGVVYSDMVIVQSEKMREAYIEALVKFAGENTRKWWEAKIHGWGTPIHSSGIWRQIVKEGVST